MNTRLAHVEDDFDRQELLYLELIDAFGVRGVHMRLLALRAALANNEQPDVIAARRRFIDGSDANKVFLEVIAPNLYNRL
jgi:hypothetical protein